MLYILELETKGQTLQYKEPPPILASGDDKIDYVHFSLDGKWDGFTVYAAFNRLGGQTYKADIINGYAEIPAFLMQVPGNVFIGVFGNNGDEIQTSTLVAYDFLQGCLSAEAVTPPQGIYDQFIADLNAYEEAAAALPEIEQDITDIKKDVKDLENQADGIEQSLDNSEQTFEGYVNEAKQYAETAEQAITGAYTLNFEINPDGYLIMTKTIQEGT